MLLPSYDDGTSSINSTTSISDNTDLRNYYDKLLFTNASGKSLNDLPRKAHAAQQINKKVNETIHEEDTERAPRIDFIEGFGHSPRANVPLSPPQEHARRRSIFLRTLYPIRIIAVTIVTRIEAWVEI